MDAPGVVVLPETLNSYLGRTRQDRRAAKGIELKAKLQGESPLPNLGLYCSMLITEKDFSSFNLEWAMKEEIEGKFGLFGKEENNDNMVNWYTCHFLIGPP
ncbi:hypothetical protein SESBI_48519 [Sesbania bispinosa]|nr:hypothetical protein SESBI_48519 [Sesbania bispinosa]